MDGCGGAGSGAFSWTTCTSDIAMIQSILAAPWVAAFLVLIFALLWIAAGIRIQKERRVNAERRKAPRPGSDRRWTEQR